MFEDAEQGLREVLEEVEGPLRRRPHPLNSMSLVDEFPSLPDRHGPYLSPPKDLKNSFVACRDQMMLRVASLGRIPPSLGL